MKRIGTLTLGCKVNHTETQAIEGMFRSAGYQVVSFDEDADIYLVNTCSVTHLGERKSRQAIRKVHRRNPNALVVVTGCYAQSAPGEIADIEGVNLIVGTQDRHHMVKWVEEQGKQQTIHVNDILTAKNFEELPAYEEGRSRAFLKVQEGCNQYCTYCIIPYTRGPLRSRSLENAAQEAQGLFKLGFAEIVLTGIHLGCYGFDLVERPSLADLVTAVLAQSNEGRVRLGSLESVEVSDDLLKLLSEEPRLCKQLHLPLQSGSDEILKGMGRPYTVGKFKELLAKVRAKLPNVGVTTDIIVGFPGETDELFSETLEAVKELNFSNIHVFPYSARRGTPAANYLNQVSDSDKKTRVAKLQELADELAEEFRNQFIGEIVDVIWEEPDSEGISGGWSSEYLRIYGKVTDGNVGKLCQAKVQQKYRDGLWAE